MCFTLHFLYFDIAIFEWLVHIKQLRSIETCNNVCHNTHKKSFLLCLSPNIILEKGIIKYKIESMLLNGRKIEFMSLSAWQMELFSLFCFFFMILRFINAATEKQQNKNKNSSISIAQYQKWYLIWFLYWYYKQYE